MVHALVNRPEGTLDSQNVPNRLTQSSSSVYGTRRCDMMHLHKPSLNDGTAILIIVSSTLLPHSPCCRIVWLSANSLSVPPTGWSLNRANPADFKPLRFRRSAKNEEKKRSEKKPAENIAKASCQRGQGQGTRGQTNCGDKCIAVIIDVA